MFAHEMSVMRAKEAIIVLKRQVSSRMALDLWVGPGVTAELDDDSAAAEAEEPMVWWPFNPGDPDGEDEPGDLVVKAESKVVDGAELPNKDPVGLPLDCVPKMVFVDPAVALVDLGRAAEDDREFSPPVGDDVVAEDVTEEAS